MKFYALLLGMLLLCSNATAQQKIPRKVSSSIPKLTAYLTENLDSDEKKAKAIYEWVTSNIAFDTKYLNSDDCQRFEGAEHVLKSRKTICMGYVYLMGAMLDEVKIPWELVSGYTNSTMPYYVPNILMDDHAWIAFKAGGYWKLADPTWDAGYVGAMPLKDNRPSLEMQLEKIEKIKRENEKRALKGKALKEVPDLDTAKKELYSSKVGFVQQPRLEFFCIPADSFHLRHLPSDPIWQLRNPLIPATEFAKGPEHVRTYLAEHPDQGNDPEVIDTYCKKELLEKILIAGERGHEFYPSNPRTKLVKYHHFLQILNIPEVKKNFKDLPATYSRALYKKMDQVSDSTLKFVKLSEITERERHKEYGTYTTQGLRESLSSTKKISSYSEKGKKWNEKALTQLEKNNERVKNELEKLNKQLAEQKNGTDHHSSTLDFAAIKPVADSIKLITDSIDRLAAAWEKNLEENALQRIKNSTSLNAYLLDQRSLILKQKIIENYRFLPMVDSLLLQHLSRLDRLYSDTLEAEMLPAQLNRMTLYLVKVNKTINNTLIELLSKGYISNTEAYQDHFDKITADYLHRAVELNSRALEHNQWMTGHLKDFRKDWEKFHELSSGQEALVYEMNDHLVKHEGHTNSRENDMYKLITKSTRKWKEGCRGRF